MALRREAEVKTQAGGEPSVQRPQFKGSNKTERGGEGSLEKS